MSDNHYYYGAPSMGGVGTGSGFGGFGNGNGIFDLAALLIVGGIFGGFGWGGGFGGFGGGGIAGATTTAAETAALVGQQQVADRVASINTGVDAVAGIATANGVKIETVKDAVTNGFYANQTSLCSLGNNIAQQFNAATMNGMQNHNNLTSQLTEMRFANAQCCCDTKGLIQSGFCNLTHQLQSSIAAEGEATRAMLRDIQTQRLQEELAAAKNQLSQNAQTSSIIAAVQASCAPKCSPCAPACNPCGNLFCSVQNAFADEIAQRIINPSTTTTAA